MTIDHKTEMTQRRAARWVKSNYSSYDSVTEMLHDLGWRSLEQRRLDARLIMFYKIVYGLVAIQLPLYIEHPMKMVGDVKPNPRDFYRYINSQKKDTQGIPSLKRKNGKGVAQSDLEKAEEFNGQFTDVFCKNEHTQVPLLDRSAPFMNDIAVSKDGVIKLPKGLNPSKALGLMNFILES